MKAKEHLTKFTKENPLPLSWSQLGVMETCNFKWYLDYVMKYRKHTRIFSEATTRFGTNFHKYVEDGYQDIMLVDNEVDMFGEIDRKTPIPDEYIEGLYFVEDWMQKSWNEAQREGNHFGFIQPWRVEWEVWSPPQEVEIYANEENMNHWSFKKDDNHPELGECDCKKIDSVWIRRMGFVDIVFRLPDGSLYLWDIKTGKSSEFGKRKALGQLYYYKSIAESLGYKVYGIGVIFPLDKLLVKREDRKVRRDEENISKLSERSQESVEKLVKKSLATIVTEDISADFKHYYCVEWCPYADSDLLLCNFEKHQDLERFVPVENLDELMELTVIQ